MSGMSGKLDKPLDEIVTAQRRSGRRQSLRDRRSVGGRPAPTAPAGGVKKTSAKPNRGSTSATAPTKVAALTGESKAIVSNLPKDVSEGQIKEYFVQSVGPIKRVELVYGPNSQSRGIATITFHKPDGASLAVRKLNGLLVDNRPIKIEIVVNASQADMVFVQPKSLAERSSVPKSQPKSVVSKRQSANIAKGNAASKATATNNANKKRRGRSVRPTKKTAEELDSEMADYFEGATNNAENTAAPAAPAATNGDAPMDDEIM